ncbi:MAG: FAD:protein FMN transferase [Spirochaetales bacterium]|nr:FAD:protein FMN transferase [Spirochaetales bacterium]
MECSVKEARDENGQRMMMTHLAMGTVMTHQAFGSRAEESLMAVRGEIARLEGLFSMFIFESDISRINRSAGKKSEKISPETCTVLEEAVRFSRRFPGYFDVTLGPLVDLWRRAGESFIPPAEENIRKTIPLVNYRDIILNIREKTAALRQVGQAIDLGGVGKGFAGDSLRRLLQNFDVTSAYSNLGGHVVTLGTKPDGSPWRVGIQHPRYTGRLIGSVSVENKAVVTSGDYRRFTADAQGKRYHHILNPATGYPSESGLISVSVVSEQSLQADLLSTLLFVAGLKKGCNLLRRLPEMEAVFVDSEMNVFITPGLQGRFRGDKNIQIHLLHERKERRT